MRSGRNPEKENSKIEIESYHRVILPVYIPNLTEEYFKDGLAILDYCIRSLLKTIHAKTRISIVNNGSCGEVSDYLAKLYSEEPSIDQLLHVKNNLGKINAVYSVVKSNLEPIITVSDADVMFLPNWQYEVEKILHEIPEAGMVSPTPFSTLYKRSDMKSTYYYAFFRSKLKTHPVINPEGQQNFEKSIGREMFKKIHLGRYIILDSGKAKAVLGCGHFVATYKSRVFEMAPQQVCEYKIGPKAMPQYIDLPNDKAGLLRLATLGNHAYHLGNRSEPWMEEEMDRINTSKTDNSRIFRSFPVRSLNGFQRFIGGLVYRILVIKMNRIFLKRLGLPKNY